MTILVMPIAQLCNVVMTTMCNVGFPSVAVTMHVALPICKMIPLPVVFFYQDRVLSGIIADHIIHFSHQATWKVVCRC